LLLTPHLHSTKKTSMVFIARPKKFTQWPYPTCTVSTQQ
jgi:hypothetical protein